MTEIKNDKLKNIVDIVKTEREPDEQVIAYLEESEIEEGVLYELMPLLMGGAELCWYEETENIIKNKGEEALFWIKEIISAFEGEIPFSDVAKKLEVSDSPSEFSHALQDYAAENKEMIINRKKKKEEKNKQKENTERKPSAKMAESSKGDETVNTKETFEMAAMDSVIGYMDSQIERDAELEIYKADQLIELSVTVRDILNDYRKQTKNLKSIAKSQKNIIEQQMKKISEQRETIENLEIQNYEYEKKLQMIGSSYHQLNEKLNEKLKDLNSIQTEIKTIRETGYDN